MREKIFDFTLEELNEVLDQEYPRVFLGVSRIGLNYKRLRFMRDKGYKCSVRGCSKKVDHASVLRHEDGNLFVDVVTATDEPMTLDHIVARSLGGNDDESNLMVMCYEHNQEKSKYEYPAAADLSFLYKFLGSNAKSVRIPIQPKQCRIRMHNTREKMKSGLRGR